jgi:hypothetical protein
MAKLPKVSVVELTTLDAERKKLERKLERKTKYAELKDILSDKTPKEVVEYLKVNDIDRTFKV